MNKDEKKKIKSLLVELIPLKLHAVSGIRFIFRGRLSGDEIHRLLPIIQKKIGREIEWVNREVFSQNGTLSKGFIETIITIY